MKDLGRTEAEMYPTMESVDPKKSKKKVYPSVNLPIFLLPAGTDIGSEITVTIKGKINRIEKSEYSNEFGFKALEAEIV